MLELLNYQFFINALIATILTSFSCGIIGSYIVAKRLVFISGGIAHSCLAGIGFGLLVGINPLFSVMIYALLISFLLNYFPDKINIREDSFIGILWAFGMALGVFFVSLKTGYSQDLMTYLFGNILIISRFELLTMLILDIVIILFFVFFYNEILYISYDEQYARIQKLPVNLIKLLLFLLCTFTIVINLRVVGNFLIIALLTIPQATANIFTNNFKRIILLSILFCFLSCFLGLYLSYLFEIPSGASIIFSAFLYFLICFIIQKIILIFSK
ncbi:MAG TPA: metal ABC transporter permease [bacterium]|nr:metal ABC transporter permease [bacterium]HOL47601.1 metal ABC transporter permease [bacterium]HPQ18716.1 metal ABC transporter permease [bacterium]